jgi:hypothetical protein
MCGFFRVGVWCVRFAYAPYDYGGELIMVDNEQLIYPTVDLFLYDLGEGLGELETKIEKNRRDFFTRIYGEKLDTEILNKIKSVEEKDGDYLPLLSGVQPLKQGDGYYYPVKLRDTYGLQIDCSGEIDLNSQKSAFS